MGLVLFILIVHVKIGLVDKVSCHFDTLFGTYSSLKNIKKSKTKSNFIVNTN